MSLIILILVIAIILHIGDCLLLDNDYGPGSPGHPDDKEGK